MRHSQILEISASGFLDLYTFASMAKTKGHTGTTTAVGDKSNKKRSAAEEHEEDSKTLKRAKPSVCKAAEELVCPILQGLPIDPVTAEDVSLCSCFLLIIIGLSEMFRFAFRCTY